MKNVLLVALLAACMCTSAGIAVAGGKPDGAKCHASKSCSSRVCARQQPEDKFGVCCRPNSCAEVGAQCGTIDDGCGTPLGCGDCDFASSCISNQCIPNSTTTTTTSTTTSTTNTTTTTSTTTSSTTSTTTTTIPVDCGDGNLDVPEECDDGANDNGDGCSAICTEEPGYDCAGEPSLCTTTCGDSIIAGSEECDDSGAFDGDGCNSDCNEEQGWTCVGLPSVCTTTCGDGTTAGTEECDDGNADNNDGCTDLCTKACAELSYNCTVNADCCSGFCGGDDCAE